MSMESRTESPRRAFIHDLTPVILLVSVLGLGFFMHGQTSSLATQIHGIDKRLIRMETELAGVKADVAEVKVELAKVPTRLADLSARIDETNARIDETNARIDATNARIDGLATTVATKEDILRLESQISGLPTRQEFDALETQVKALQEERAQ